ncbi:syntaxin-11-like [Scleropages formosus]|nr:syntaxin-11-like isoform X2 [Scleropages formosus]XP_018584455.1 syntaxin-11-like isoform X2 [Scleropages formosus]XP_018584463.1 syntaxin-11-like isoform X2 [Scleropages formosus]KPP73984.1 syntaxin-11-like [Scleropages formosus]
MRDRLTELQEVPADGQESMSTSDTFSNVDLDDVEPQQAVVFDHNRSLDTVFEEAQEIRREIQLIRLDVNRLREQNSRILSEAATMSAISQDSNAIAADIKSRGEAVLARLQKMAARSKELEETQGSNSAVARVARTQYVCLSNNFRDAMFEYNDAEMSHRENCKSNLQRQLEIVGKEVSGEQIEEMMANDQWNVFTENVQVEGKTVYSALNQIESRHKELLELENRVRSLHELFLDAALLVEEQGPMMNTIQANINKTDAELGCAMVKLGTAKKYDSKNPFKRIFCGCFPCYK